MIKRILTFLRTDLHWILLALGLSVFLWLISMTLLDPEINEPYWRPLFLDNLLVLENENVILLNKADLPENILVGVRAPASLHGLDAELEIRPLIDFRAISGREVHEADEPIYVEMPVSVNLPPGFVRHHLNPSYVIVKLDARYVQTFPISVVSIGETAAQTELQRTFLANRMITLTGARFMVQRVNEIRVEAHLTGLSESTTRTVRPMALDSLGDDISDYFEFNITETELTIEILPIKRVDIIPQIVGELAEGFVAGQPSIDPPYVYIVGPAERLAGIEALEPVFNLEEIELEEANNVFERVFYIEQTLPAGVRLAERQEQTGGHFHMVVEPIRERVVTVARRNIGVFGGAHYTILDDPTHVLVRVSGPASLIGELNAEDILAQLNLHDHTPGTHHVVLNIILPPGLQTVGEIPALYVYIDDPTMIDTNYPDVDIAPYNPAPHPTSDPASDPASAPTSDLIPDPIPDPPYIPADPPESQYDTDPPETDPPDPDVDDTYPSPAPSEGD